MMIAALTTTIVALVPSWLALLDISEAWVWRGAAIVALVTFAAFVPTGLARMRRMAKMAGYNRLSTLANQGLLAMCLLLVVLCAIGWPAAHLDAIFVGAMLALLSVCGILFFRVVYSMLRTVRPD